MKILITLLYVISVVAYIAVAVKWQSIQLAQLRRDKVNKMLVFAIASFITLIIFFQYWLLTGVFPYKFIILLLIAGLFARGVYKLIGAIVGFALKEKKEKIGALGFIYGAKSYRIAKTLNPVVTILFLVSVVGSIWMYWKFPIGSPHAKVWIAVFLITVLQFSALIYEIVISWPIVSSEYIDDDIRNSFLASKFSSIITFTLMLLFPFWVIRNEFSYVMQGYNIQLPNFWVLLSIPLILFLLTNVFPFFLGMYKYRAQTKAMLNWRKEWLTGMIIDNKLPKGNIQDQKIHERVSNLERQIKKEVDDNDVLNFYKNDVNTGFLPPPKTKFQNSLERLQSLYKTKEQTDKVVVEEENALVRRTEFEDIMDPAMENKSTYYLGDEGFKLVDFLSSQKTNLIRWDLRIKNIDTLLGIYKLVKTVPPTDLNDYLVAEVANIDADKKAYERSKNILAGAFVSILSSVFIWLFKLYEDDITNAVKSLIS